MIALQAYDDVNVQVQLLAGNPSVADCLMTKTDIMQLRSLFLLHTPTTTTTLDFTAYNLIGATCVCLPALAIMAVRFYTDLFVPND